MILQIHKRIDVGNFPELIFPHGCDTSMVEIVLSHTKQYPADYTAESVMYVRTKYQTNSTTRR